MNYIRHLKWIYSRFLEDERLNPSHVSLYMAIFQEWNSARFPEELYINRQQLMQVSKVRSRSGYHRSIKELDALVDDHRDPILEQVAAHYYPKYEPVDEPYINSNKQKTITNINIKNTTIFKNEIIEFFKSQKWPLSEGNKFFEHYESEDWRTATGRKIINWKAVAQKWMKRCERWRKEKKETQDFLKTSKHKNYGESL